MYQTKRLPAAPNPERLWPQHNVMLSLWAKRVVGIPVAPAAKRFSYGGCHFQWRMQLRLPHQAASHLFKVRLLCYACFCWNCTGGLPKSFTLPGEMLGDERLGGHVQRSASCFTVAQNQVPFAQVINHEVANPHCPFADVAFPIQQGSIWFVRSTRLSHCH